MASIRPTALALPLLALVAPGLQGQILPGGPPVEVDRLRGEFYTFMVGNVRGVMEAWHDAWRGVGGAPFQDLYAPSAVLLPPGGVPLRGEEIGAFAAASLPHISDARAGMQHLDAAEGMALFSGSYTFTPFRGGTPPSTGRHFTLIRLEGKRWLIRLQLFLPDSLAPPFPAGMPAELLEPINSAQLRGGPQGQDRLAAYADALFVLTAFRDAWNRKDVRDAASFFWEDAYLRLPHERGDGPGVSVAERLGEAVQAFAGFQAVDLDFDRRDRLSYILGRYHAQGRDRPDRPGHFLMVLRSSGSGWKIQALVFAD